MQEIDAFVHFEGDQDLGFVQDNDPSVIILNGGEIMIGELTCF